MTERVVDTGNLPAWAGADRVYERMGIILREMGRREHAAFVMRKKPLKSDRFAPSETMTGLIEAMNRGDEEALKAAVFAHRDLLDAGERCAA